MIGAGTRLVAVVGWPISHSLSPAMHNAGFRELGLDMVYVACPVHPRDFPAAVRGLRALGAVGCNVTVPHKEQAAAAADLPDPEVTAAGAANTLVFRPEGIQAFNTDGWGFVRSLEEAGSWPPHGTVLVLGAGGAARGALAMLARSGAGPLAVANRSRDRARALVRDLGLAADVLPLEPRSWPDRVGLLVNATGLGRSGQGEEVLAAAAVRAADDAVVVDYPYSDQETVLSSLARTRGLRVVDGRTLLLWQGVRAFELFTGQSAPVAAMRRAVMGGNW